MGNLQQHIKTQHKNAPSPPENNRSLSEFSDFSNMMSNGESEEYSQEYKEEYDLEEEKRFSSYDQENLQLASSLYNGHTNLNQGSLYNQERVNLYQNEGMHYHNGELEGGATLQCDQCKFVASKPESMKLHETIHLTSPPYTCPFCPYESTNTSHFNCHILTHHNDKPFFCELCSKRFTSKLSRSRHKCGFQKTG